LNAAAPGTMTSVLSTRTYKQGKYTICDVPRYPRWDNNGQTIYFVLRRETKASNGAMTVQLYLASTGINQGWSGLKILTPAYDYSPAYGGYPVFVGQTP